MRRMEGEGKEISVNRGTDNVRTGRCEYIADGRCGDSFKVWGVRKREESYGGLDIGDRKAVVEGGGWRSKRRRRMNVFDSARIFIIAETTTVTAYIKLAIRLNLFPRGDE